MYTVRNISLDKYYEKYGTKNFRTLTEDQTQELCRDLSITAIWKLDERGTPVELDMAKTIEAIIRTCTVNEYMPQEHWTTQDRALAVKEKFLDELAKHSDGSQTFKLFADYQWGLSDLKPGETQTLNVPRYWIETYLLNQPCGHKLEIKDENGELVAKATSASPQESIPTADAPKAEVDIDSFMVMKFTDLQRLAKAKGMEGVVGRTKEELVEFITAK